MKQKFLQRVLLLVFMLVVVSFAYALPPPPPPPGGPSGVPIDGGVFLLLGAGLFYGARKLYKEHQ